MTTFNTGNPIGSTDSRDRLDNSENMDILENSTTLNEHADRLGTMRKTRKGMELEHDNQIAAHESEHDNQISAHEIEHDNQIAAHEAEHDNQMQSFENDFDSRLAGMAFTRVGTFTTGATLTDMRQTLLWEASQGGDGHEYGWSGSFPKVVSSGSTPETTGGVGAGSWVDRTDNSLRDEIRETVFQNMKRLYAEAGFNLVNGSFQIGGSLSGWPDVLWDWATGVAYQWHLDESKTIAAGSTPTNIGTDWIDKSSETLTDRIGIINKKLLSTIVMINDESLVSGDIVETLGFTLPYDMGGAKYKIQTLSESGYVSVNGSSCIALNSGLVATLYSDDGFVRLRQFGAAGDGSTDDWNPIKYFCDYVADNPVIGLIDDGIFYSETTGKVDGVRVELPAFRVRGVGKRIIGTGNSVIHFQNDYACYFGTNWMDSSEYQTRTIALTASAVKGDTSITVSDVSGYSVNDFIMVFAGNSSNGSEANPIPIYKQWVRIKSIDTNSNVLTLWTALRFPFAVTGTYYTTARISGPGEENAIDCHVEGVELRSNTGATSSYNLLVNASLNCSIKNSTIDSKTSLGSMSFSDNFLMEDMYLCAYNGFGSGRGTCKLVMRRCDWFARANDFESGASLFIEETPELVIVKECNFYGTTVFLGNSGDTGIDKRIVLEDTTVESDGKALRIGSLYNSHGYALEASRCRFVGVGAQSNDRLLSEVLIDIRYCDSFKFTDCEFSGMTSTCKPIYIGSGSVSNPRYVMRDCKSSNSVQLVTSASGVEFKPYPVHSAMVSTPTGDIQLQNQQLFISTEKGKDSISPVTSLCGARRGPSTSINIDTNRETGILLISGMVSTDSTRTFTVAYLLGGLASGVASATVISSDYQGSIANMTTSISSGILTITNAQSCYWHVTFLGSTIA